MRIALAFSISVLFSLSLFAGDISMPPSMPVIPVDKDIVKNDVKKSAKKEQSNDACKIIPPMLVHLPPMLEKDLDKCKNSLYMPSIRVAEKRLQDMLKRKVKVRKVSALKGFSMLYKIESNTGDFYCNRYVDRCITPSMKVIE